MRGGLLIVVALAGAGCWSTTTVGSVPEDRAQRWFAEHGSSDLNIETIDRAPDQTAVIVQASSPTEISFRTRNATVVPIDRVRRVTVVRHGLGALEGGALGTAIGAGVGALYGMSRGLSQYERSSDCTIVCNNSDAAKWGALMYGVFGLVSGTLFGAVIGHHDVLELR
jgi:uncharacterized membrane protein